MLRRRSVMLFLSLVLPFAASGQAGGILGLPDRIMSSSRIGRVSSANIPELQVRDTSSVDFPEGGTRWVSEDYPFFKYLSDNNLKQDALTLVSGAYAPSDTLDFLRAKVLFSESRFSTASRLFGKVPPSSAFGPEALHYRVVSLASNGDFKGAARTLDQNPYSPGERGYELSALQGAGIALLRADKEEWDRRSTCFTYGDFAMAESERILKEISSSLLSPSRKSPGIAAALSAVVPGAGKVYAGRLGEGVAAFLTVGSLGAITAENWCRHGLSDWRTIVAGTLCATFYLGNIYGSYMSVSVENDERIAAGHTVVLYHIHLPLRYIFR